MMLGAIVAAVKPPVARRVRSWLFHLGGVGLIPLGLVDSSVIPLPGSVDLVTIILSSRQGDWWPYYAFMATAGSVLGGFVTYRLARKGGKETLDRKLPRDRAERIHQIFAKWGFGAIAISALLPPPMPMVPFLLAAGAMQYPVRKFLAALTLGRAVRYTVLAYLSELYGQDVITFVAQHERPVMLGALAALLAAAIGVSIFLLLRKSKSAKRAAS
ncbi:MAG TPA: VTT domain-containing protein [Candidatus Acidoferrales bacterium]|jgi:membrane protein YqaA with SNARE-associated domain|nr:VTT domain-containing protein [Candidatus Acidoferrales bacterium]